MYRLKERTPAAISRGAPAASEPDQRTRTLILRCLRRMRTRFLARARDDGALRSMRRADEIAAPASMMPQPRSALQPPERRALCLIRRILSCTLSHGFRS